MSLIPPTHDSLPYIDPEPTSSQRAAAEALILDELSPSEDTTTHPLLPPPPPSNLTPLLQSEFSRIASSEPLTGIDASRYESLAAPESDSSTADWREALQKAHTSLTYLTNRRQNLETLDTNGKEEWLSGNEQLVEELKALEKELAATKEAIDLTAVERRNQQESVRGEMEALEQAWKGGVGRVLETEVAAEQIRGRVLAARRGGA